MKWTHDMDNLLTKKDYAIGNRCLPPDVYEIELVFYLSYFGCFMYSAFTYMILQVFILSYMILYNFIKLYIRV